MNVYLKPAHPKFCVCMCMYVCIGTRDKEQNLSHTQQCSDTIPITSAHFQ